MDQLYNFTQNSGWRLIFDLNVWTTSENNSPGPNWKWNSTNTEQFLNYTSSKGYAIDFELGNGKKIFSHF